MNGWQILALGCFVGACFVAMDNPPLTGWHGPAFAGLGAAQIICMALGWRARNGGSHITSTSTDNSVHNSHNTTTSTSYVITNHHHHHAAPTQDVAGLMREVEAMRLEMQRQARLAARMAERPAQVEQHADAVSSSRPAITQQYRGELRAAPAPLQIEKPKRSLVLAAIRYAAGRR